MKSGILLIVSTILISHYSAIYASNPDSTVAQRSSSKKHDVQKRDNARMDSRDSPGQPSEYEVLIYGVKVGTTITEVVCRQLFPFTQTVCYKGNFDNSGRPLSSANNPPQTAWQGSNQHNIRQPGNRGNPSNVPQNSGVPGNVQIQSDIPNGGTPNAYPGSPNRRPNPETFQPGRNTNNNRRTTHAPQLGNRRQGQYPDQQPSNVADPNSSRRTGNPHSTPINTATNNNRKMPPDSNLYAGIINDFAFKLVDTLNLKTNFVISPLSIFAALSMCYLGSEGTTKTQLEKMLGLSEKGVYGDKLHQGIRDLINVILPSPYSDEYQLFLANGMFLGKNFDVNPEFERDVRNFYAAELKNLDFGNSGLSMQEINDWVSKATRNMIRSMSDSPPSYMTQLLVLNAIFFKGTWKTQFPEDMTFSGRFFNLNGEEKRVPTMVLYNETFPFHRSDSSRHSFIKLPYKGEQISMVLALPYSFGENPMSSVTDEILCYARDAMVETRMDTINIPKFRFEFTIPLKESLQRQGIKDIFNAKTVNLSKLRKQNDVVVDDIQHKAVIDVNEQGSSAAAVTAVKLVPLSYRNTTDFLVNRPFAFYIIHEPSGLVLFYGKMYDNENITPPRDSGMDYNVPQPASRNQGVSADVNRNTRYPQRNRG